MIIHGVKHSYSIPAKFIRKTPDTIFGLDTKLTGGDNGEVTSLIIPNSSLIKDFPNENESFILSGLIFWDKDYSKHQNWKKLKKNRKLVKLGIGNSLHTYKSIRNPRFLFYFNFDIDNGIENESDAFLIQKEISLKTDKASIIGGKEFKSPKSCDIRFLYDGMDLELSPLQSKSGCDKHLLPKYMEMVKNKLDSWRIKNSK